MKLPRDLIKEIVKDENFTSLFIYDITENFYSLVNFALQLLYLT